MVVHCFMHVPFEKLGYIQEYIDKKQIEIIYYHIWEDPEYPHLKPEDLFIILGGPMGVNDNYNWLEKEKQFIKDAIFNNNNIIGICLGAQLIASALGAQVFKNQHVEIGWFDLQINRSFSEWVKVLVPEKLPVFHWHGDTYDCPPGAINHASSLACNQQMFTYGDNVIGLQFHLEANPQSVYAMVDHERSELIDAPFIQSEKEILKGAPHFFEGNKLMSIIIDKFLS